jgi:hypothetical protein
MERLWVYTGHPTPAGDLIFDIGLGYHPNRNVMDAFAGVGGPGRQWNFRASRRLRPDPLTTTVGPLSINVIKALRRHRLALGENDSGIRFEIEFIGSLNPHEEKAHLRRRDGRVTENMARAQQLGRYSGWLEFDGRRVEIDANWLGQRDHSWGVRAEMRSDETHPPLTFYPPFFYCWTTAQFKAAACTLLQGARARREDLPSGEEVFAPAARSRAATSSSTCATRCSGTTTRTASRWQSAQFHLTFADGSERPVSIRVLPTKYFLKGGLYGGLTAGSTVTTAASSMSSTTSGTSPTRRRGCAHAPSPTR